MQGDYTSKPGATQREPSPGSSEDCNEHQPDPGSAPVPAGQPEVKTAGCDYGPIDPRQLLLGTNFCRGFLSGLTGAGATGKTAILTLQLIALALDRGDLVGERVFKRTRVLLVCLEDDETEIRRRIRAACIHHNLNEAELAGWLYYWTPRDLRFLEIEYDGEGVPGHLGDALRDIIKHLGIGLVAVDPFVKSHGADENDNMLVDQAASQFLRVAFDCGCACDYVHHHRKGITLAGEADAGRGASALANASRLVKTATKMTRKEAEGFPGVEEHDRKRLVRIDDAKLNIAPPADQTVWFRLVGVDIGNPTEDYPEGDNVQTVERWYPPDAFEDLPKTKIAEIFAELRKGPSEGEFYLVNPNANDAWAGWPIAKIGDMEKGAAKRILKAWNKSGTLIVDTYHSPRRHKDVERVTLNEIKAREILGPLYQPRGFE
jgi:hypothetical protein